MSTERWSYDSGQGSGGHVQARGFKIQGHVRSPGMEGSETVSRSPGLQLDNWQDVA